MTTWSCPLCDFSTTSSHDVTPSVIKHATEQHPAYLDPKASVAEMLSQIPTLLREAVLTIDAPNPSGPRLQYEGGSTDPLKWAETRKGAKTKRASTRDEPVPGGEDGDTWSPTPRAIALAMKLSTASESSLFESLVLCSRIIWENLDAEAKKAHPQPIGHPSWATEVRWLTSVWGDAQAYLDEVDIAWIRDEVRDIWRAVATFAGVRRKPKYVCPTDGCREPMDLHDDGWMRCAANHQHPGPKRLESQWRRKAPMSTKDICAELRIPEGTVWRWRHEGRITPTRQEGRVLFWLPWDVIALRYPDIVAEIDGRDAA